MRAQRPGLRRSWRRRDRGPWAVAPVLLGAACVVGAMLEMRGRAPAEVALAAGFSAVFVALAWADLEHWVIPNRLVYPALVLALAVSGAWPDRGPLDALTGGLGALAAAITIRGLSGGGLGGGDAKMAALAGAVVGYPGVLSAGLVAAITGGATAATLLVTRRAGWSARMPYGPFLALGAVVALLG